MLNLTVVVLADLVMAAPASNGVPAGVAAPANQAQEYNPHALVGSLIDEEEEPVPLLYFTSVPEAWVRSPHASLDAIDIFLNNTTSWCQCTTCKTNISIPI